MKFTRLFCSGSIPMLCIGEKSVGNLALFWSWFCLVPFWSFWTLFLDLWTLVLKSEVGWILVLPSDFKGLGKFKPNPV
jgi:hypothetical protein